MKLLVFWYCDSFCDCQMLHLAGSYDPAKSYLGIFWRVIMFGCYNGIDSLACSRLLCYNTLHLGMFLLFLIFHIYLFINDFINNVAQWRV